MKPEDEKIELILRRVAKFTRNESWRTMWRYVLIIAKLGLGEAQGSPNGGGGGGGEGGGGEVRLSWGP